MLEQREFYIDGRWVAPATRNDLPVIDPATEEAFAVVSLGGQADTDAAVAAATRAFDTWSSSAKDERSALLRRIVELYRARLDDIGEAVSREMGAPIDMARAQQAGAGVRILEDTLAALEDFEFDRPLGERAPDSRILYEPIGVCALITPWNWPLNQVMLKVAPALAAGCTMVLKPSEIAPLSSMIVADVLHEAGTPAGVFNLVNGDGAGVGTQLCLHPDVAMISFTGSTRAGALISKNAADTHKRVSLELGGKGANIVFGDAPDKAIKAGAMHCFHNTGQSCNAPTRMLVQRDRYEAAIDIAAEAARACRVGAPGEPGRHIGPLASGAQFEKVQRLIETGMAEGARLAAGGPGRPEGRERGWFVKPTVFADVHNGMTIAREEIFGPVLSIIPFDTEDEAVAIANDTPYGLTNYVQSADPARCRRVARRLRSGMVEVNGRGLGPGAPFGGMKASGNGREGGVWGLEEFLEVKAVSGWAG